jgi:hypothetical protein
MKLEPDTLANAHERMARIKARSDHGFFTNYFRQDMVGERILVAATDATILLLNDEYDFFRLYFFSRDFADLGKALYQTEYPGDVVVGYLTKKVDQGVVAAVERASFRPIATYGRMETYALPKQQTNPFLEYAVPADTDQLHQDLFRAFNKYTDHLPTKKRLLDYIRNNQVIVKRQNGQIVGGVCFQLHGFKVNYNHVYSLTAHGLDFLQLQNNFYGVMNQRGVRAGFLWINLANDRLASLYRATGWRFDGLQDYFYFRALRSANNFA